MAQHLWHERAGTHWRLRLCEVCDARQITGHPPMDWPRIDPICPGDPDDTPRRASRRRPLAPAGGGLTRELEPA